MATLTNTNYFSPTQIAGCALWLDAADTASVVTSGSSVTQWNDKSGNARHMSNSASYQSPIYNTTGFIGRPTISFFRNSSTSFSMLENRAFSFVSNSYTLFLIIQRNGSDTSYQHFFSAAVTPDSNPVTNTASFAITTLVNNSITMERNGAEFNTGLDTTIPFLGEIIVNGTGSAIGRYNSLTTYSYVNGNSRSSSSTGSYSAGITLTLGHVRLGAPTSASSTNGGSIFQGNMSEVLYFNRALTTIESQQVEGYLAWKWGLQASLPTTHPYFYNPMIPNLILPAPLANPLTTTNTTLITMNPTQIAGCALWVDTADVSSLFKDTAGTQPVTTNGDIVRRINDKSGNGRNATTSATTNVYTTSQSNGNSAIQVPSDSGFATPTFTLSSANTCTLFIVALQNPPISGNVALFRNNTGNNATLRIQLETTLARINVNSLFISSSLMITRLGFPNIYSVGFDSSAISSFFNGTSASSGQSGTSDGSLALPTTYAFATNTGMNGFLYEVILYNTNLTTTQRQQIEGYLAWKWGLQANLPTTHPYYYNPLIPNLILPSQVYSLAPSFSPLRFSGSALWLDAADTASITLIGNNITNVNDKSGQNVVLSNATGFSYRTNLFNGSYPSFYNPNGGVTNATNARLGVNASFAITVPFTVFFVGHDTTIGGDYGYVIDSGPSGTFANRPYLYNGSLITQFGNTGTTLTARSPFQGCAQFYSIPRMFVNGSSSYTGSLTGFTTPGITVGNRLSLNEAWPGHICEIIIYSRSITVNEQQQIEGYLAWKWGLQANLPATHPYFFAPPS